MLKPFKLQPTYRDYVWGGSRLRQGVPITAEAWVIFEGNIITNGRYAGCTLAEAALKEGTDLLGKKPFNKTGSRFPLLIKLLDSAKWLSLQVHPNDEQAERMEGPGFFGKTEAWYIVEADEGAELLSGFKDGVSRDDIKFAVGKPEILDLVVRRKVHAGDSILMSPGTIHTLGSGLLVYEVQQTSDLTYRVYDWDRLLTGRRKLHIDQAIEVLDPNSKGSVKPGLGEVTEACKTTLVSCEYFSLDLIVGNSGSLLMDTKGDSFSAITVLDGNIIVAGNGWEIELEKYDSLLVPAACLEYKVEWSEQARALQAYVP
jgi:mannose-6-phosphate isomerase